MILAKVDPRPDMLAHYNIEIEVEKRSSDPEFMRQFMDEMMGKNEEAQEASKEEPDVEDDVEVKDIITDIARVSHRDDLQRRDNEGDDRRVY